MFDGIDAICRLLRPVLGAGLMGSALMMAHGCGQEGDYVVHLRSGVPEQGAASFLGAQGRTGAVPSGQGRLGAGDAPFQGGNAGPSCRCFETPVGG